MTIEILQKIHGIRTWIQSRHSENLASNSNGQMFAEQTVIETSLVRRPRFRNVNICSCSREFELFENMWNWTVRFLVVVGIASISYMSAQLCEQHADPPVVVYWM